MLNRPSAKQFFEGKSIFLTGATGYVGRFLVYKILKDFNIKNIYIILRPKRGKQFEERAQEYRNLELFDQFLPSKDCLNKIIAFPGDICHRDCGLTEEQQKILQDEVDIVIHSAASIRFTEPLKRSCVTHIEGTDNVVELAAKMPKLEVFLHVSSFAAFMNETETIEDVPYETCKFDPFEVAAEFRNLSEDDAREREKNYIGQMPKYLNSYSVTKTMAEIVVVKKKDYFKKVAIVRPPFLVSSNSEPKVGWFDEPQDGVALAALFSLGFLRVSNIDLHASLDVVPVDVCANALLSVIWYMGTDTSSHNHLKVFNLQMRQSIDCTGYDLLPIGIQLGWKYPSTKQIRPPTPMIHYNESKVYNEMKSFITHTLFSLLIDFILIITGRKPLLYELTSKKISAVKKTFQKITDYRYEWIIHGKNMDLIHGEDGALSQSDKQLLFYDLKKCNWYGIAEQGHLNFRRKVLKEPDDTLPYARKRLFIIDRVYTIFTFIVHAALLYMLYQINRNIFIYVPWMFPIVLLAFVYLLILVLPGDIKSYVQMNRSG